jgi:hypothetical protein
MMGPIDLHFERLRERYPDATMTELRGTGWSVCVPNVCLPAGWSKSSTRVLFIAPQGYPFANPDCFWTDADLRLANNGVPQNANPSNPMPGSNEPLFWFSWHLVQPWNPSRDDFLTWMAVMKQRFARAV